MPTFFATISRNLEPLLADELQTMGLKGVRPSGSGVFFEGELRDAYRVCLFSRLTTSVLMEIGQFEVLDADSLYDGIRDIDWSEHMSLRTSFAVDLTGQVERADRSHALCHAAGQGRDRGSVPCPFRRRAPRCGSR